MSGTVPGTQDTGKSADVSYAVGKAKGVHVLYTDFLDLQLCSQGISTWPPWALTITQWRIKLTVTFFITDLFLTGILMLSRHLVLVDDSSTFSPSLSINGLQGLMGLGFDAGSIVRGTLGDGPGDTPLSRIFQQNKTTQNYISILLDRANDPTDPVTGQITISELVSGYENIASQPKLDIKDVVYDAATQHWAVFTDKSGVTGPDGNAIDITSIVPHVSGGQLVAVLDSGFSFSQVPRKMSDAIYGRVQGANYSQEQGLWLVPCTQELNISFTFGGINIPVHPLDTVSTDLNLGSYCAGTVSVYTVHSDYHVLTSTLATVPAHYNRL